MRRTSSFGPSRSDRNTMLPQRFCGRTAAITWKPCCDELYVGPTQHGTPWGVEDVAPPQHSGPKGTTEVVTTVAFPGRTQNGATRLGTCFTRLQHAFGTTYTEVSAPCLTPLHTSPPPRQTWLAYRPSARR